MVFRADGSVRKTDGWTDHRRETRSADSVSTSTYDPTLPDILNAIRETSARHRQNPALARAGLEPDDWHALFRALIEAESNYRPTAMSPKGAFGLGQLMPETARALGVDRRDIAQNLDGSARYFLAQLDTFSDIDLALAAYNSGPHRVTEYSGVPPFAETRTYIARVHRIRVRLSRSQPSVSVKGASKPAGRATVVLGLN